MSSFPLRWRSAFLKSLPSTARKAPRRRQSPELLEDRTVPAGADMFADAYPLDPGTNYFEDKTETHEGYSPEKGDPSPDLLNKLLETDNVDAGTTMWYKFTLKESGTVVLDTFGSDFPKSVMAQESGGPYGDTILVVFTANDSGDIESLEPIAWNNDFKKSEIPGNSYVEFDAKEQTTYYVMVSGYNTEKYYDRGTSMLRYQGPTTGEFPPKDPAVKFDGSSGVESDEQGQYFYWYAYSDSSGIVENIAYLYKDGEIIDKSGDIEGKFNFDDRGPGTYTVEVTPTNKYGEQHTYRRTVTVYDDDVSPPSIGTGGSAGSQNDGQTQSFSWSISDVSGSSQSIVVKQDGKTVFSSTNLTGSFSFDSLGLGTFVMEISATDFDSDWSDDASSTFVTRSVTVTDDDTTGPTVSVTPATGSQTEDQTQLFQWTVTDLGTGTLSATGTITKVGTGVIGNISTTSGSFNFDSYGQGTFVISVTGADGDNDRPGDGATTTVSQTITVTAAPAPKTAEYGDAPDSYKTTSASGGAQHIVSGTLVLGTNRDAESDGKPSKGADSDDTDQKVDDEDGVTLSTLITGHKGSVVVLVGGKEDVGFVNAWIDFNGNGVFEDKDLITSASGLAVKAGNKYELTFTVPSDATTNLTYARFRISSAGNLGPAGSAADGEVEDYALTIQANSAPTLDKIASTSVTLTAGAASNNGKFSDANSDTVTFTATKNGVTIGKITSSGGSSGNWNWSYNAATDGPVTSGTVIITASDGFGGTATTSFALVSENVKPDFTLATPVNLTTADHGVLTLTTSFTDPDDVAWTGTVDYGDGATGPLSINAAAKTFTLSHPYKAAGPYTVTITIDDGKGSTTKSMTVNVPTPAQVFVDDDWASLKPGSAIADADPVAAGNQPAMLGYDAFASLASGITVVSAGGAVNVNGGVYAETVSISKTITVNFQEKAISVSSLSDTISTVVWKINGVTLSIGAGSLWSPVGGSGGITKTGPGTLTFIGAGPNTYTGTTTVADGTLVLAKSGGSKGGSASIVGPVVIGDGNNNGQPAGIKTAILQIDTAHQIADTSTITFVGNDGRLFVNTAATETIASPTIAAGDIKIAGSLTMLTGYTQTAGSTTTLAGGTLRVGAAGTLDYSLAGTLQGSGTIFTKMLTTSGVIDPSSGLTDADVGNASPGVITIRGNLLMTASSVTNLDVGTVSDQLNVGINTALPLPAGSYSVMSNYELDPYLRGDAPSVTEQAKRGINNVSSINGVVRFGGTLNTKPIGNSPPPTNPSTPAMNFVWRAMNLSNSDLDPKGANLSSVPSDFSTRTSATSTGVVVPASSSTGTRFDARFMGSAGQVNAISQSVAMMTKVGTVDTAILAAPAFAVGQAKALTLTSLTSPATTNANLKMTKQVWNANKDSHSRITVTVANTGSTPLTGPFYLEIKSIPKGATVFNASGKTQAGLPYLVVVPRDAAGKALTTLAAGATTTVELDLLTPMALGKTAAVTASLSLGGMP